MIIPVIDRRRTTTTDIGALVHGFPRESSSAAEIGGVRTNFRMPDILSIGVGGGSRIRMQADGQGLAVGPDSVGFRLLQEAIVFGGETLTEGSHHRGPEPRADVEAMRVSEHEGGEIDTTVRMISCL